MTPSLQSERGSALVTAILISMLFMTLGLATLGFVDTQQSESGRERVRESSFSLAEGALNSQIYLLSRQWPRTAAQQYTVTCTPATSTDVKCPDEASMVKAFNGVDYRSRVVWSTEVHDNSVASGAGDFYDDAVVRTLPGFDQNGDNHVWVRAQAVLDPTGAVPHRRTLVALIRAEDLTTQFPRNAVVAGKINVHPAGNQTYLSTNGSYVTLRCTATQLNNSSCRGWSRAEHVGPNAQVVANVDQPPAMSPETLERMRETARANGTYFGSGTCPASLTGALVFIENADACDRFNPHGRTAYNSALDPGALIIGSGKITLDGNAIYHGVIYNANGSDGVGTASSADVVTLQGGACVVGSVVIDGLAGLKIGSNNGANVCQGNLQFDPNVANRLKAYGTAGIVQNSFREIKASD
jgi:hypothetical protein